MSQTSPSPTQSLTQLSSVLDISWKTGRDYGYIFIGSLIQALAMRLFLIPANIVSGGISGLAQLINHYTHWPIGLMVFIGNVPLFILGWRFLGGPRFALRTAFAVASFSLLTDNLAPYLPANGVTSDLVLNSLYGGVLLGVGLGLVYRGRGTSGGSDILGRILNDRLHVPLSQAYLVVDGLVVLGAGFVFGWDRALYGLVMIYVSGITAEMTSEGTDVFRTALIITNEAEKVSRRILDDMERGVTVLPGVGGYTGADRPVLLCVISRAEVNVLKALVREVDPNAFMVIGHAQEALGEGFHPLKKGG
ncbi:MAG TPA: YitT family protein [Anaerolineaceae bacterium]|nr:YitT family protein [Anaerolineaceae bacterium]